MQEENLIFIASQPRAGSTFLQNVLSNNLETNTVSEPWLMLALAPLYKPELIQNSTYDHRLASRAFSLYQDKVNLDIKLETKALAMKMYKPLFLDFKFVVDKTPRYWEVLPELVTLFPKAKIIVLKRNPLEVVNSIIQTWDISSLEKLNYYRNDLLKAPKAIDDFLSKQKSNPNIIEVYYNDIISNKHETIERLYKTIGIDFSEEVLDTSKNDKYKGKYGDPYQNSNTKKNKELNPNFKAFINGYANYLGKPFFLKHNYRYEVMKKTKAFNYFINLGDFKRKVSKKSILKELTLYFTKKINKF